MLGKSPTGRTEKKIDWSELKKVREGTYWRGLELDWTC